MQISVEDDDVVDEKLELWCVLMSRLFCCL